MRSCDARLLLRGMLLCCGRKGLQRLSGQQRVHGSEGCTMHGSSPASRDWAQGMLRLSLHPIRIVQVCVDHRLAPALVPCCRTGWEDVEKEAQSHGSPSRELVLCCSRKSSWDPPTVYTGKCSESSVWGRKTHRTWAFLSFPGKGKMPREHLTGSRPGSGALMPWGWVQGLALHAGICILGQGTHFYINPVHMGG